MNALIIGGTKFIGRAITLAALASGHSVTVFNRGRTTREFEGVDTIIGNVDELVQHREAIRARAFDVVIHCIAYTEQHGEDLRGVFSGTSTRIVLLSSIDCYEAWQGLNRCKDLAELPITEDSPLSAEKYYWKDTETKGDQRYTYDKNLLTDIVMAGCTAGAYEATTFRLPLVWGPYDYQIEGRHGPFIQRILDGRKSIVLSDREQCQVYSYGYVDNLAAAIIHSLALPQCNGKIYNIGEKRSRSKRRWLELYGEVLGYPLEVNILPEELLRSLSNTRIEETPTYRNAPPQHMLVSTAAFRRDTGFQDPIPLDKAIKETFAYAKAHPETLGPTPDYAAEDQLVRAYTDALNAIHL